MLLACAAQLRGRYRGCPRCLPAQRSCKDGTVACRTPHLVSSLACLFRSALLVCSFAPSLPCTDPSFCSAVCHVPWKATSQRVKRVLWPASAPLAPIPVRICGLPCPTRLRTPAAAAGNRGRCAGPAVWQLQAGPVSSLVC